MKSTVQRVTSTGITFQGKGSNESVKVYLYPASDCGEWSSTLYNSVDDSSISSLLNTERILYFRLKSTQKLTIKCSTVGKLKVL